MDEAVLFDTVAQWQKYFDTNFPHGLLATQIRNTEEAASSDESPQVLMYAVQAVEIEEDGDLILSLFWAGIEKDTMLDVERVEERDRGCYVVTSDTETPDYLFSRTLTPQQREVVSESRRESMP